MKKSILALLVFVIVLTFCASCGCSSDEEGALPTLKVGDTWTYRGPLLSVPYLLTSKAAPLEPMDIDYTVTTKVTGKDVIDGKDCYVLESKWEHPKFRVSDVHGKINEATMDTITAGFSIGESASIEIIFTYEYLDERFPLEVGKTYQVIEGNSLTEPSDDGTVTTIGENTYTCKVEGKETVTVPAGAFECFKIVKYDEEGSPKEVSWLSGETKMFDVKTYDYGSAAIMELLSYSLD